MPSKAMVPESAWCTPARTLTRVDLPAPLSPTMATTSPAPTSRSMSVSAFTAPKVLVTPRRLSRAVGGPAAGFGAVCHRRPPWGARRRTALRGAGRGGRAAQAADGRPARASRCPAGRRQEMPSLVQAAAYSLVHRSAAVLIFLSMISALRLSAVTSVGVVELGRRAEQVVAGLGLLAVDELGGDLGRGAADDLARLADGVVLVAGDDQLQAGHGRVVAADRAGWG